MVMRRVEDWPLQLSRFLRARQHEPFAWGTNDCLIFPADAVKLITNVDVAAGYRGTYDTEEAAKAHVEAAGGMVQLLTQALGVVSHRNLLMAKRGDVAMIKYEGTAIGGIVDDSGQRIATVLSDRGVLVRFPLGNAWRIWSY